jgi:hypothetical protein
MNEDAFQTVLLPILRELEGVMDHIVLIGGWVPELHRRFGSSCEWRVKPLGTLELDVFLGKTEEDPASVRRLARVLLDAGFRPVGEGTASAIWERDVEVGERLEFFLDHAGTWQDLSTVRTLEPESGLGALLVRDLGIFREKSVALQVPLNAEDDESPGKSVSVQVPELGAFLIHKGAIFRRRPDPGKQAKDLHYIVDVMQSGEAQLDQVEKEIRVYCRQGGGPAEIARQARNHLGVVIREAPETNLRSQLASGIAVRHHLSMGEANARAVGFLSDFRDLIPEDCGDSG